MTITARIALTLAPAAALAACAMTPPATEAPIEDRVVGADATCSPEPGKAFVGRKVTAELGAEIHRATGASIFQWVPPDSAVTMDYRKDRVRVSYDREMMVTAVRCG